MSSEYHGQMGQRQGGRAHEESPITERVAVRKESLRSALRPFVAGQKRRLVAVAVMSAVGGLAEAVVLVLIARAAFGLSSDAKRISTDLGPASIRMSIEVMLGVAAVLILARLLLNVAQAQLSAIITASVLARTRKELARSYLGATWALQAEEREGRLQNLLTTDATIAASAVLSLCQVLAAVFNLAAFVAIALFVDPMAALAVAGTGLALGALIRPIRARVRSRSRRTAVANQDFATALSEVVSTAQEVRIFQVEDRINRDLARRIAFAAASQARTRFLSGTVPALYQASALGLIVAGLAIAHILEVNRLASIGAILLVVLRSLTYGQVVQTSLQSLHEAIPYFQIIERERHRYACAAVQDDGLPVDQIHQLSFERVSFQYESGLPVLSNVSFEISNKEIVGIVGPSGAGKSTLVQLMLRLRDPSTGTIRVDGRDASSISLRSWYEKVSFVPQDPHLFAGTVAENIRFHRDHVDELMIVRAARSAHLDEEIRRLSQGYDTWVGERGNHLSGGQRQRLCIARALAEEPGLIVLDEPTSALDPLSEALMRDTLEQLAQRMVVVVIAHRVSTLSICNRIMVVHDGTVRSFEEPEELEKVDSFYREMLTLSGIS